MKHFLLFLLAGFYLSLHAQAPDKKPFERKGFVFGGAAGVSYIQVSAPVGLPDEKQTGMCFPNLKVGYMLTPRLALLMYLPRTSYVYKGDGRERGRGFESFIPSVQYWTNDRFWLIAGAGLDMDAPVFYDMKEKSERKFYFGPAAVAGAGYEFFRKGRIALDVQGQIHYGQAYAPDHKVNSAAYSILVGLNWY